METLETRRQRDIRRCRDFYFQKPDAPLVMREFGWYSLERWEREGWIRKGEDVWKTFDLDEPGNYSVRELGWCEAAFDPCFEVKILEDRGEHEVVQDTAGRHVLYFKGKRDGFMPEYLDHPVKDQKTWEEQVKWRLDPKSPHRFDHFEKIKPEILQAVGEGKIITEQSIGGYMYLRSLMGPEKLLYAFYDMPELIHDCMQTWLALADSVIAEHQKYFDIDELFIAEDICYNVSSLTSHDMMREFLFPYYQQLIAGIRSRQKDKTRKLFIQVDTDGAAHTVIDVYKEIGVNFMSPFEVASGNDVVELRKKYPDLLMTGGFDKRILAKGKEAIDREVDRIMPFMKKYGGYIPTCDHGVPEEVSFENYLHFRNRLKEFS